LFNLESNRIILALSSLVSFVASVIVTIGVVVAAAVIGGSLCYYTSAN